MALGLSIRLRQLRKASGMTQGELSNTLHVKRDTYAQYETGRRRPDYETLILLADYFDCSVDYLLGRTNIINPKNPPLCCQLV